MATSTKPYLVRALYEWMLDNNLTPFVSLDTTLPGVKVPVQYIKDGQIVLNITPTAVQDLKLTNQKLSFIASFSSIVYNIEAPMRAVMMIYSKETGQGMAFDVSSDEEYEDGGSGGKGDMKQVKPPASKSSGTKKPTLKVVK